jgi:hypothetical protein
VYIVQEESQATLLQGKEIATLAGGCFWCLEAVYDELNGVEDVVSGYSGGMTPNPSYEMVCTGTTGCCLSLANLRQVAGVLCLEPMRCRLSPVSATIQGRRL